MKTWSGMSVCLISLASFLPVFLWAQTAEVPAGSGTGTDPFRIASLDNLYWLTQHPDAWNDTLVQTAPIDATPTKNWDGGKGFAPIGGKALPFSGSYDGQGQVITGLTIQRRTSAAADAFPLVGMFGLTSKEARIRRVALDSIHVEGLLETGGVVGQHRGIMEYCYATGDLMSNSGPAGGLVGQNDQGIILSSWASVSITGGPEEAGGLAGSTYLGLIQDCYATGNVTGSWMVGGLSGENVNGPIRRCFASGKVTYLGTYKDESGGLIGVSSFGYESDCYWDVQSTSKSRGYGYSAAPSTSVYGLQTRDMMSQDFFPAWNFDSTWGIREGVTYPYLKGVANRQIISFPALPHRMVGDPDLQLLAKATSGNRAIYTSSDTLVAKVEGDKLRVIGPGEVMITATQPGDSVFAAARPVPQPFLVIPRWEGTGTADDPYLVRSMGQLRWLSRNPDYWSGSFIQTSDLDATGSSRWNDRRGFSPIGDSARPFRGTYNGKGHLIANLTINPWKDYAGLFGVIDGAKVDSLGLVDVDLFGRSHCAGLVGRAVDSKISECFTTGVVQGSSSVGGLVGSATGTWISRAYSVARIVGSSKVGGVAGSIWDGTLRGCFASGSVRGDSELGGLLGLASRSAVDSSFWNSDSIRSQEGIGSKDSATTFQAAKLTTTRMTRQASFGGWDFTRTWSIEEGKSFPKLRAFMTGQTPVEVRPAVTGSGVLLPGTYDVIVHGLDGRKAWQGPATWDGHRWMLPRLGTGGWILQVRTAHGSRTLQIVQIH